VTRVVPGDALLGEARALAMKLAAGAPRALALTKRALDASWDASLDEQLETEARLQGEAGSTADHGEGIAAFLERRPPRFTGE
jgi:2-(1,2-epoxy-1,2-dihydrophenyl)acetyl-CoA isomerase